jgi:hypothetical protein
MSRLSKKLRKAEDVLIFFCPGCKTTHGVKLGRNGWLWNDDVNKPTFTPSLLSTAQGIRCHLFVREGRLEFLGDCSHKLAGKTVDIPDWPYGE